MFCVDCLTAVVVIQNATVLELKKAIQRHVVLRQARIGGIRHISWYDHTAALESLFYGGVTSHRLIVTNSEQLLFWAQCTFSFGKSA